MLYYWSLPVRGDELRVGAGEGAGDDDTYVAAGEARGWGEERGVEEREEDLPEQPRKKKETSLDSLHNNKTSKAKLIFRNYTCFLMGMRSKQYVFCSHTDHPFVLRLRFENL